MGDRNALNRIDILSRSSNNSETEQQSRDLDSPPSGSVNEANDKVDLRKYVAAFAAINMLGQSDARTNDTSPAQIGERSARAKLKQEQKTSNQTKDPYKGYLDANSKLPGKIASSDRQAKVHSVPVKNSKHDLT